jgi:CRP/FNR family transcriptional regulator, cyclic AMP receptor protein
MALSALINERTELSAAELSTSFQGTGSSSTTDSSPRVGSASYRVVQLKENEFVFKEGEAPKGLYFVQSGCVKIVVNRTLTRGRMNSPEFIRKVIGKGEFFGHAALIKGANNSFFAKTLKPTELHVYSPEVVSAIMNGPNSLVKSLLQQLVKDLESHEVVEQLHYLASVQERIAYQLLLLSDKFGVLTARGMALSLKLTRNELAQLAGTINESLSRHLTEFKNEGILELNGREIIIIDRQALMQKSGNISA